MNEETKNRLNEIEYIIDNRYDIAYTKTGCVITSEQLPEIIKAGVSEILVTMLRSIRIDKREGLVDYNTAKEISDRIQELRKKI
jgi:hypothetical protein